MGQSTEAGQGVVGGGSERRFLPTTIEAGVGRWLAVALEIAFAPLLLLHHLPAAGLVGRAGLLAGCYRQEEEEESRTGVWMVWRRKE